MGRDGSWTSTGILEMYALFKCELFPNLRQSILKMIRKCLFAYASSGGVVTHGRKTGTGLVQLAAMCNSTRKPESVVED